MSLTLAIGCVEAPSVDVETDAGPDAASAHIVCGDGEVGGSEACDDGADNGGGEGYCLADCSASQRCDDGVVNGSEVCDQGINDGGEGKCLPGCGGIQICGDGATEGTEACDDGPTNGAIAGGCDANCAGLVPVDCGDAMVTAPEACDDGVNDGGEGECLDGCSGIQSCGDGVQNGTEICDDGATNGFPGACNLSCDGIVDTVCGDGIVTAPEVCDDGGGNGMGCLSCLADCSGVQDCGDGVQNGTEACDDGATNGTVVGGCNATCSGAQLPICGDGVFIAPEVCDDGVNDGGGVGECEEGCVSAVPAVDSTCTVHYTLSVDFRRTDTPLGGGDRHNAGLDGNLVLTYRTDGANNIVDGPVEVTYFSIYKDIYFNIMGVELTTNLHSFAPNCDGVVDPTWRLPSDPGFPMEACDWNGADGGPVAIGVKAGATITWSACDSADYWSGSVENDGSYQPTDTATGPGCLSAVRELGNVRCTDLGYISTCGAGELNVGDNRQDHISNWPMVHGPTGGGDNSVTIGGGASATTITTPTGACDGFESYNIPNDGPYRSWLSWTATRREIATTTCN